MIGVPDEVGGNIFLFHINYQHSFFHAVYVCNGWRASNLAKSLFPVSPAQKLKMGVIIQPVYSLSKDDDRSPGVEKFKWRFSNFEDCFLNHGARYRFNIGLLYMGTATTILNLLCC